MLLFIKTSCYLSQNNWFSSTKNVDVQVPQNLCPYWFFSDLLYGNDFIHVLFRFCTGMAWDKDGDTLAIIQDKNGTSEIFNQCPFGNKIAVYVNN